MKRHYIQSPSLAIPIAISFLVFALLDRLNAQPDLHVVDQIRIGQDPNYPSVYGELKHEGSSTGFKINAHANGGWADMLLQTDGTTRMFLESGGNIGIGTDFPTSKLHVFGSQPTSGIAHFLNYSTAYAAFGALGQCNSVSGAGIGGNFWGGRMGSSSSVFPDVSISHTYFGSYGEVVTDPTVEGIGTNYGVYGFAHRGDLNYGVYGSASGSSGSTMSYGVYGHATGGTGNYFAGYFAGNATVTGTLSKGGGSFKIDHPLDVENKYLYHSFVESPDMMNIYNDNVVTDMNGEAIVEMPDYFEPLNREFRYQLTVIGEFAQAIISEEINDSHFSIKTDKPNVKVSWQVTGIRQDAFANAHRIQVEEEKPAHERGKYLHPEVFGMPREMGVDYHPEHEAEIRRMEEQKNRQDEHIAQEKKTYSEDGKGRE